MRLRPSPFVVPKSGDPFVNDTLDRKDQIEALTELLRNVDGPCVLAVDGAWGSGKTAFLKMWARFLRSKRFRVAEYNAWETDFSDDPLMALYAALESELGRLYTRKHEEILRAAATVISKLAATVPLVPDVAGAFTAAAERPDTSPEARLARHRDAETAIGALKLALAKAAKDRLPLVVCVDELDRCRPDYAIRFLEATKQIFDVDGVVFVLAVNLSELANSVGVAYGEDFDGITYLRRFVDRSVYLPQADRAQFLDGLLVSVGLGETTGPRSHIRLLLDTFVVRAPHMSLRDIEQAIHHLGMVLNATRRGRYEGSVPLDIIATTLMLFRMATPDTYRLFTRAEITDLEALAAINGLIGRDDQWWKTPKTPQDSRVSAKMEAILTGWGSFTSGQPQTDSPLLLKRRSEAEDSDNHYAASVVSDAEVVASTDRSSFAYALALVDMVAYVPPSDS